MDTCSICLDKPNKYFTLCNHSYCIDCLCKINKCALCRKNIEHYKLSDEVYNYYKKINENKIIINNKKLLSVSRVSNGGTIEVWDDPHSPSGITTRVYFAVTLPENNN